MNTHEEQQTLKTFRFWFEPDEQFPMFKRLTWELVDVSIRDVLTGGVHPWTANPDGTDAHPSLGDAFLQRFNETSSKPSELESFGYCHDVSAYQSYYYERKTRFERTLESIRASVYFVEGMSYLKLLDIAKQHLRERWDGRLARTLAEQVCSGFQDLRQFLKSKDASIKLSGYGDLEQYDLGQVLSLEDFEGREAVLVSNAFPNLNFREASFLQHVTDNQGRLRLKPDIRNVTLTMVPTGSDYVHLVWHVERNGDVCRFMPEIGNSEVKRGKARDLARQWRADDGRLCFSTNLDRLVDMVEQRVVVPSFPTLNYTHDIHGPTATARVCDDLVQAFHIGVFNTRKSTGDTLKDILHEYGVSMTGNKEALTHKLAKLAAREYTKRTPEMDAFFAQHRFVRIDATPPRSARLPLLEDAPLLRSLLLTMYAMKHLRGNAVLDVAHDNNTYTEEQLAHALLTGKVGFTGTFLRVS